MNIIEETQELYNEVLASSLEEVARKKKFSNRWLEERLGLLNLIDPLKEKVNNGKLSLCEAYKICKLSDFEQVKYFLGDGAIV